MPIRRATLREYARGCRCTARSTRRAKKTVCTEQISFFLSGDSPGLLRNIVFSHLDSDLPLAFWWKGEFSDAFERGLYSRIDRLLFDSESWAAPRNQFLRLLEAQGDKSCPFVMHDFAFTRMNSIRSAIANAFDRPALAQRLGSINGITLRTCRRLSHERALPGRLDR